QKSHRWLVWRVPCAWGRHLKVRHEVGGKLLHHAGGPMRLGMLRLRCVRRGLPRAPWEEKWRQSSLVTLAMCERLPVNCCRILQNFLSSRCHVILGGAGDTDHL